MKLFKERNSCRVMGSIIGLAVIFCVTVQWDVRAESLDRTFEVTPGGLLKVRTERGSVEVVSGSSTQVRVEIIPKGWDLEELQRDFEIRFDQTGNEVFVDIERKGALSRWFSFGGKGFVVQATVPFEFNLDLATSGGTVSVGDLKGEIRSTTSGGSLHFGQIEGSIWGRTSGGEIHLKECIGDVDVETSGGDIEIGEVDGKVGAHTSGGSISMKAASGSAVLETSGGSISLEEVAGALEAKTSGGSIEATLTGQPEGDSYLGTSGGSVTVKLAPHLRFNVDAKTGGGKVRTDIPLSIRGTMSTGSVQGELNGGGPQLVLRTSGGDIRVQEASALH